MLNICLLYSNDACLKGTYHENNTFPGIWGVVLGLWCSHTHTNFEKRLYMIFWVRYAFIKVPRLQLPNERVSFGSPSYVGRGHSCILPPTSLLPSNKSIATILWTSGRAAPAGGTRRQLSSGIVFPELSCQTAARSSVKSLSAPCRGS